MTQPEPVTRSSCIIIFDWDDTLFPTTFLNGAAAGGSGLREPSTIDALQGHARRVEEVLRAARRVALVSIVTLAGRPWVLRSARRRLPGLDLPALLLELGITVFYATAEVDTVGRPGFESEGLSNFTALKRKSMARCLGELSLRGALDTTARLSVLSIGDAVIEKGACKQLIDTWATSGNLSCRDLPGSVPAPLCKTLKLMEAPTMDELGEELRRLPSWLGGMALCQKDFDVQVSSPSDIASGTFHKALGS